MSLKPADWIFMILVLLLLPLVYLNRTIDPVISVRLFYLSATLAVFHLILMLRSGIMINVRLTIPIISYLLYFLMVLVSLTVAVNRFEGLFFVARSTVFLLIFLTFLFLLSRDDNLYGITARVVLFSALTVSLTGLGQYLFQWFYFLPGHEAVYSFFANRNLFASALFLTLPFTIYVFFTSKRILRIVSLLAIFIPVFLIIIVKTRAVWLALISGAVLVFVVGNVFRSAAVKFERRTRSKLLIILLVFLVAVTSGLFLLKTKQIGDRNRYLYEKSLASTGNFTVRYHAWINTVKMIEEYPLLGVGPGNWKIIFPKYGIRDMKAETGAYNYMRPHNDLLWVASENGIAAGILYLSVFAVSILYAIRIYIRSEKSRERIFALCTVFGITGYLMIAGFSFPLERIYHSVLILLLIAAVNAVYAKTLVSGDTAVRKQRIKPFKTFPAVFLILSLLLACFFYYRIRYEIHFYNAHFSRMKDDFKTTIAAISKIDTRLLNISPTGIPLTWYRGNAYFQILQLDEAFNDFHTAYRENPYFIYVINNLASSYEIRGETDKAIELYNKVLDISPAFGETLLNLSAIYYNQGKYLKSYRIIHRIQQDNRNPRTYYYRKKIYEKLWVQSRSMEIENE